MVDGIAKQNQIHTDNTWRIVVIAKQLKHILLKGGNVEDVFVNLISANVVACKKERITKILRITIV